MGRGPLPPLVIGKYIFDLFSFFYSIHDAYFYLFIYLLSFSSWLDASFDGRGHHRQVNDILGNLLHLHYPGVMVRGADRSGPATG
jgi:hypothetical protein